MHPHLLHCRAAACDLGEALTALETRAREAVDDAVAGSRTGDVPIPSQQFGRRHALGGHGDPTAVHALGGWAPGGPNPYAQLLGDIIRQLDEAAVHVPGAPGMDPLARIRQRIPQMRPEVAARTCDALAHLDGVVRRRLQMPPTLTWVPGECPACRQRLLYWQTSAPPHELTVICRSGCVCAGQGCRCGMPVRVEGVTHIWDRSAPLVAHALAGAPQ